MRASLASVRLGPQHLVGPPLADPAAVVGHLGAVQSQLHDMSLWAVGRRCGATLAEVEGAFAIGDFVRTHVLRPTWHHVLRSDLRDLLEVTAPRVRKATASHARRDGLTSEAHAHWSALALEAVRSGGPLTRPEVEARLAEEGFERVGNSMAHVMIEAELTGEIHSGAPRGKQQTYVAASLPASRRTPDERLGWLARTYAQGHGPVTPGDLSGWAGLTLTQSRRAFELGGLEPVAGLAGDGLFAVSPVREVEVPAAALLSAFDEFISYVRAPEDYAGVDGDIGTVLRSAGLLFVDGGLAGSWVRKVGTSDATVTVLPRRPLTPGSVAALEAEVERYGRFVGVPTALVID